MLAVWVVLSVVGIIGVFLMIGALLRLFGIDERSPEADGAQRAVAALVLLGPYTIVMWARNRDRQSK
jgi:uncharacterized membrane protein